MDAIKIKPLNKADFEHWENRTVRPETADYWIKRAFRAEEAADKTDEELLRDMSKVYRNAIAELEKEIQAFYGRYAEENGLSMQEVHRRLDPKQLKSAKEEIRRYYEFADPKKIGKNMSREYRDELRRLSARAYMSRLEEIKMRLKQNVIRLAAEEQKKFEEAMKKAYSEAHSQASYTLDRGLGFSEGYSAPSDEVLNKVVSEKWLGSNFSDRIWQDKGKLLTSIENELLSGIAQGHNPRKIADAMAAKYGQDYKNCERLARTETIHTMNSATYDCYKEHGVEKYQFVCGLDERTCPECGALDGTVHDVRYKEEGVNYPVIHPNCYDDKTEVLTREGWKLFRECSDDDEYFSMNPDNPGETDYLKASARISDKTLMILEFRYGRKLVRVTENHDMLVKYGGKLHFMKAKNLLSLSSNAIGRDIFILDDRLEEIPLSDFSCTLEQGWFSVYCVELPKWHALLVRRDGAGVWSGNCRCTTIPFFEKDDIDALFEESSRVAYDEGHKIYDVPASMTYKEWLETIGSNQQKEILGKSRYEMHVNGVPLSDFVKNGKLLTLSSLRESGIVSGMPKDTGFSRCLYTSQTGGTITANYKKRTNEEKENIDALKAFAEKGSKVVLVEAVNKAKVRTADCTTGL